MIEKKFKHKCPLCQAKDKTIIRCSLCFSYCCSSCSIELNCIDCYVEAKRQQATREYFEDKYKEVVSI